MSFRKEQLSEDEVDRIGVGERRLEIHDISESGIVNLALIEHHGHSSGQRQGLQEAGLHP